MQVDAISSEKCIYLRKNIKKIEALDSQTQALVSCWEYDELEIPKGNTNEFYVVLGDLLKQTESIDAIMMALADIYEKLEAK